ncbi:MAG: DUF885 domain-containing protein, partial [Verrucomicrobiota bacterium]
MKPLIPTLIFGLLVALFAFPRVIEAQAPPANDVAKALRELFDSEWNYAMEQSPTWASSLGDRRWNDRWEDASLAAIQGRHEHDLGVLVRLKKINRSRLSPKDQLNYDLFQKQYETNIEEHQYRWYLVPLNQREGIQTVDELADALRFQTVKDYEDWIARLRSLPVYMDQTIALMREGVRTRIVQPKVVMERIPAQIDKQLVDTAEASAFYKPFRTFPKSFPEPDRIRLVNSVREAIGADVIPAFKHLKQFFADEYLPACLDKVGAWQLPYGDKMYAFFARKFTTTKLTPAEIHEIGLKEVARIRAEMQDIIEKVGFQGTREQFFNSLRTDPQFFYGSPQELLQASRAMAKRIDPELVKVFKTLPRIPYGVEPIPDKIAPDTTTAYYRPP